MHRFESPSLHDAPDPVEVKKRLAANREPAAEATVPDEVLIDDTESQLMAPSLDPHDLPESPLLTKRQTIPEGEAVLVLKQTEGGQELPALMDHFSTQPAAEADQPVTAELKVLRTEWHDLAQQLFSPDKAVSVAAKEAAIGKVLDLGNKQRYTIEKALGQGGYGSAFLARDQAGVARVVKLSEPFNRQEMFAAEEKLTPQESVPATHARTLIAEVAALKRLSKLGEQNPGPALIDAQFMPDPRNPDQRIATVVMELIDGVALNQFAAHHQHEPLTIVDAVKQLATALEVVHGEGIVHSDLKPSNIMVDQSGKVKLIDFGAVVIADLRQQQAYHSPRRVYNPPEAKKKIPQPAVYAQAAGQAVSASYANKGELATPARDRYSLGRVMQFLVFTARHFNNPKAMQEMEPKLSYPYREMAEIAKKLVRDNPKERASLGETLHLLDHLAETEGQIEGIKDKIAAGQ